MLKNTLLQLQSKKWYLSDQNWYIKQLMTLYKFKYEIYTCTNQNTHTLMAAVLNQMDSFSVFVPYSFYVVSMKSRFMSLSESLYFVVYSFHLQVSMEIIIPDISRCTEHVPQDFIPELLKNLNISLTVRTPKLKFVVHWQIGIPPYQHTAIYCTKITVQFFHIDFPTEPRKTL